MLILFVTAIILSAGALALNIIIIFHSFKESVSRGIIALLAPLFLAGGISGFYYIAHKAAIESVGTDEARASAAKEFEQQKNELDDLENIEL